jgi:hypothetical protein
MSKFMHVCGVVLAAVGLALAVVGMASPGQMQVYGLTPEIAAILLVGGILSLGLGSLIGQLANVAEINPVPGRNINMFDKSTVAAGAAVAATAAVSRFPVPDTATTVSDAISGAKSSVAETIEALEQAKSDIRAALGGAETMNEPELPPLPVRVVPKSEDPVVPLRPIRAERPAVAPPVLRPEPPELSSELPPELPPEISPEAPPEEPAVATVPEEVPDASEPNGSAEPGLFVVEEQSVRGKPARLLSDGTVEAETDEGWMRFENMEHLNEYLDSVGAS